MTNLFDEEKELYATASPEVADLLEKMKKKYMFRVIFHYLLQSIFMAGALVLPYLLLFSWWAGPVGFFFWIGLSLIFSIFPTLDVWKDYKKRMETEERQIRLNHTKSAKLEKFLEKDQSKKVLTDIGLQVEKEFFANVSDEKLLELPLTNVITEKQVNNNERLVLVEKELDEIQKFDPSNLISKLQSVYNTVSRTKNDGIPLSPIEPILRKHHIDEKTIEGVLIQGHQLQELYKTAKAELEKEVAIMSTGISGENRLNQELDMYEGIWKALPNIRIKVDNQSAESDNIVICKKGIFTIEAKNYSPKGNYSLHITKDGQWLKVYSDGDSEPINNVTSQMNYHIALKQKLINAKWKEKYGVITTPFFLQPIFVIANDMIRIQNDTDLPIMRIPNIYHHIMKLPDIYTQEEVDKLTAIILENALPPKKFSLNSYLPGLSKAYNVLAQNEDIINRYSGFVFHYVEEAKDVLEHKYI